MTKEPIVNIDKLEFVNEWHLWVNEIIIKHSRKPFKSKNILAKAIEYTINPYSNKKAFKLEDGSYVDCHQVKIYNPE
jgi:hypothetical protein